MTHKQEHRIPLVSTFISWEKVLDTWQILQNYKGECKETEPYILPLVDLDPTYHDNKYYVIYVEANIYYNLNFLTDCFTESARLHAKRFDQEYSPFEYWKLHGSRICKENPDATCQKLRAILYKSTVEVMNFRLSVAVTLYDMFMPHSIFDPCAGHGDRAIAAMSRNYIERYDSCEPNIASFTGILNAIKLFKGKKNINVYHTPFENYVFQKNQKYDLIFTSPPYFDVEVYCQDATQSILRFSSEEEWYTRFLRLMFLRCWQQLNENGHMIISMNNVKDHLTKQLRFGCTERLVKDLTLLCPQARYLGVISYGDHGKSKRREPMFVWKKIALIVPAFSFKTILKHQKKRKIAQKDNNVCSKTHG